MVPLSLWMPFERYRRSHRLHHIDQRITDPLDDPESFYWTPQDWARLKPITRVLGTDPADARRAGDHRFLLVHREGFCTANSKAVIRNQDRARVMWLEHLLWCVPVILWVKVVCGMPLGSTFSPW